MQVKEGLLLRKVGVQYIVAPTGEMSKEFNGMLRLNAVGAFLFEQLLKEITMDELLNRMTERYDITKQKAEEDVKAFLAKLKEAGLLKGGERNEGSI